jgi:hypothetical protein
VTYDEEVADGLATMNEIAERHRRRRNLGRTLLSFSWPACAVSIAGAFAGATMVSLIGMMVVGALALPSIAMTWAARRDHLRFLAACDRLARQLGGR